MAVYSSPLKPCGCCRATDGKCKAVDRGSWWCFHTRTPEQTPDGWLFKKLLGQEMGAFVMPKKADSGQTFLSPKGDREQEEAGLEALSQALQIAKPKPAKAQTQAERDAALDTQFRSLLSNFELSDEARRDFRRRGLRDSMLQELELKGHRQVKRGDSLPAGLDLIHGVSSKGRWALPSCELMPLFNAQGQIVACQMRTADGNQLWLSSEERPMQRLDGSWPVTAHNVGAGGGEINAVDGVKKAALVAAVTGMPTFGSAGSRYMSTLAGVREFLDEVCPPNLGNYTVTINFDAGDPENTAGLARELLRFAMVVSEWGFTCRLRFWHQLTKPGPDDEGAEFCDLDELLLNFPEEGIPQTLMTPEEFYALLSPQIQRMVKPDANAFNDLGVHDYPKDRLPPLEIPRPRRDPLFFENGAFIASLRSQFRKGRYVMDQSLMGLGKSFRNGNIYPEQLGFSKVVWVSSTAMDTWHETNLRLAETDETNWAVVRGRDGGRVWETGKRIIRKTADNADRKEALPANCVRSDQMDFYLHKGLVNKAKSICKGCPSLDVCRSSPDWYLRAKQEALQANRVICHPLSLPTIAIVDDLGQPFTDADAQAPGTLLVLEEAGRFPYESTFHTTITDVLGHATAMDGSGLNPALCHLMTVFANCLRGKTEVDFEVIWRTFQEELSPGGFDSFDEADVQEWEEAQVDAGVLSKAWFRLLVTVACGDGRAWMEKGRVNLMTRNKELLALLRHPGVSVLLSDGTGNPIEAEEWLGGPVSVIAERPPTYTPAEIHQITGLGRLGYTRTEGDRKKVNTVLAVLPEKFGLDPRHGLVDISSEISIREKEGHPNALGWMQSSRGSNICVQLDSRDLVMIGAPMANVTAQFHRYCLRRGAHLSLGARKMVFRRFWTKSDSAGQIERHVVEGSYESIDPGFREELRAQMEREVLQARHRLREVRRGTDDRPMRVFWICDCAMPTWEVTLWDAEDLCGDLLQVLQLNREGLVAAAKQLLPKNQLSLQGLAQELKVGRNDVVAALKEVDLSLQKLRTIADVKKVTKTTKRSTPARNVRSSSDDDRAVGELSNRFPKGTKVSYRGELEGKVVGYEAGPPGKVVLRYIAEDGNTVEQAIPGDFLELAGQPF